MSGFEPVPRVGHLPRPPRSDFLIVSSRTPAEDEEDAEVQTWTELGSPSDTSNRLNGGQGLPATNKRPVSGLAGGPLVTSASHLVDRWIPIGVRVARMKPTLNHVAAVTDALS